MKIMNCPNCEIKASNKNFNTWNNVIYSDCKNCGCSFQNPIIKFDYNEDHWETAIDPDGVKRNFITERDFRVKNWFGNAINFVNNLKPGKILDVGCGLGCFLSAINNKWQKQGHEIGKFPINYINKNYPNIETLTGDILKQNLVENSYDVIMFYHVIEHVDQPKKFLSYFNKLLKSGGYLIVGTPNNKCFVAKFLKKKFRHYGKQHVLLYSPSALKNLLEFSNFHCQEIEFPYFGTDYAKFSNLLKLCNPFTKVAPAFYGNVMTFYARKK